jgi:hypothetical protein
MAYLFCQCGEPIKTVTLLQKGQYTTEFYPRSSLNPTAPIKRCPRCGKRLVKAAMVCLRPTEDTTFSLQGEWG